MALQVRVLRKPPRHDTAMPALQPGVQVAPAACVDVPLLHAKVDDPDVGAVASVTVGEVVPLGMVEAREPVHVAPPTVQLTLPEHDALQVAPGF